MPEQDPDINGQFLAAYGDEVLVRMPSSERAIKLGQALLFEAMFCTADDTTRSDPVKRARFLAGIISRGGDTILLDEHAALLEAED